MPIVMYHRVWGNKEARRWPHMPYLHIDDFRRQLDWFAEQREYYELTFDDGLRCHLERVVPELEQRGVSGMFFVPAQLVWEPCGIHRVHDAVGRGEMSDSDAYAAKFVDFRTARPKRDGRAYCLDASGLRELQRSPSVWIETHGVRHWPLSKLTEEEVRYELRFAWVYLAAAGVEAGNACAVPYGGAMSHHAAAKRILDERCAVMYDVAEDSVGCTREDNTMMRVDCNRLPHGASTVGVRV